MSASAAPALSAIAFQLAATLDHYDETMAALVRSPMVVDPELYQAATRQMDQMRMYAASLPPVSVAWVEVMIRHFELTHALWHHQREACTASEVKQLHTQLRDAVQYLARKCVQLMPAA
jgi:hypothetical protein